MLDARFLDSIQYVVELLLADGERHVLHRADASGRRGLGALRDLEEASSESPPHPEVVAECVSNGGVAAVAGAGPQADGTLRRVHQRHARTRR